MYSVACIGARPPPNISGEAILLMPNREAEIVLKGLYHWFFFGKLAYMGGDAQHMSFFPADSEVLELDFPVAKLGP